jgi:integrase
MPKDTKKRLPAMKCRLTKKSVNALSPKKDDPFTCWDTDISGFGVRVMPSGDKAFHVRFRLGKGRQGTQWPKTIGKVGSISVDKARRIAMDWKAATAQGIDPLKEQELEASQTFAKLAEDYLELHASKKRSGDEDKRYLEKVLLPLFKKKLVSEINHKDIQTLHHNWRKKPFAANRIVALLSKMFSMAVKWEWIERNPAKGIEKFSEEGRERYLSLEEMNHVLVAMDAYAEAASTKYSDTESIRAKTAKLNTYAIKLLMVTGARSGEVFAATWEQFDLENEVWVKPSSHTKQKRKHRIPLSPPALTLLQDLYDLSGNGEFLFPSYRSSTGHIFDVKKAWAQIRKAAGVEDVRVHDLRHSYAALLVSGGASLEMIGKLLGHTQAQTTHRYAHLMDDPLRHAASKAGAAVEAAGKGEDAEIILFQESNS